MKCCIIHQKLQMLNCSILHKIKHQQHDRQRPRVNHVAPYTNESSSPALKTHHGSSVSQCMPPNSTTTTSKNSNGETATTARESDGAVPTRPISDSGSSLRPSPRDEEGGRSSGDESEDEFFEALEDHDTEDDDGGIGVSSSSQVGKRGLGEGGGEEEEKMEGERERKKGQGGKVERKKEGDETRGKMEGEGEMRREGETGSVSKQQTEDQPVGGAVGGDEGQGGRADVVGESGGEGMGRLMPCGDLVLIATGEPMYIPVTQVHISTLCVVVIEITFLPLPALHVVAQLIFPKYAGNSACAYISYLLLSLVCLLILPSPWTCMCVCVWYNGCECVVLCVYVFPGAPSTDGGPRVGAAGSDGSTGHLRGGHQTPCQDAELLSHIRHAGIQGVCVCVCVYTIYCVYTVRYSKCVCKTFFNHSMQNDEFRE